MSYLPPSASQAAGGPSPQQTVAHLELTVQGSRWSASPVPPTVFVNGQQLVSAYGTRVVPVWAGPVRVDVVSLWTRQYGQATLEVVAQPGDLIPVFYAAPLSVFQRGSIGHVKQRRRGWPAFWIAIAVMVLAVAIPVTVGVLQGNVTP